MNKLFWLIFWLISIVAFSQEKATISFNEEPLNKALFSIEKIYNVRFSYSDIILKNKTISLKKKNRFLFEVLVEIEEISAIKFHKLNERYYSIKTADDSILITQELNEITIFNYLAKGISKDKKGFFTIKPTKLEILPGLIEADVLESIQQLPGVLSPNETATGLIVRGGTQDQNRILWDGINIYHNGHLFGMISAFNPNVANKITFHNKGTNPRFGERISSVIEIETTNKIEPNTKASFSINGNNSDIIISTPIIKNKLNFQVSTRRSYADVLETPTFKNLSDKVFQTTKITNRQNTSTVFYFTDYNTKINYQLNKNNRFSFSGIYINNHLDYLNKNTNSQHNFNDVLNIKNQGYALDWNKNWSSNLTQKSAVNFSKYRLNYNLIEKENTILVSNFDKRNIIFDTNFNTEIVLNISKNKKLNLGYQYNFKDVSYAFLSIKNVKIILDHNQVRVGTHSFFTNYSYLNNKLFNFDIGARLNYYNELDEIKLEPRFIASKNLNNHYKLQVTGEVKNQIISQIDETVLSDLSLENKLWHLADNKNFPITNSKHLSLGLLYKKNSWSFDIENYYKNINGLTALSLGYLNPDGKTFRIGEQQVKGAELYVNKDWNNLKTWISYSYTNVKSHFKNLNNDKPFTANTSITHAISTSMTYKIKQFQIALGWRWRTGKPYTKSVITDNKIQFLGINTENLPNYHRLDFSSTYQFKFSNNNKLKGKIGLSIRNIYNQKNHLSREYSGFNNLNDPITVQDKFSLGFTPNFIFKIYL